MLYSFPIRSALASPALGRCPALGLLAVVLVTSGTRELRANEGAAFGQINGGLGVMSGVGSTWSGGFEVGGEGPVGRLHLVTTFGVRGGNKLNDPEAPPGGNSVTFPITVLVGPRTEVLRWAVGGGLSPVVLQLGGESRFGLLSPSLAAMLGLGKDGFGVYLDGRSYLRWFLEGPTRAGFDLGLTLRFPVAP